MDCGRCGKGMIRETIYTKGDQIESWRCLYCGEYLDDVIIMNRGITSVEREMRKEGWVQVRFSPKKVTFKGEPFL